MRVVPMLFDGRPSLAINLPSMVSAMVVSALAVVAASVLQAWWGGAAWTAAGALIGVMLLRVGAEVVETLRRHIRIDGERIRVSSGVVGREVVSLELHRVQNVWAVSSWWERAAGVGTLVIETSDPRHPVWRIAGLPGCEALRDVLTVVAVRRRAVLGIREIAVGQV